MSREQAWRYVEHCVNACVGIERERVQRLLPGTEAQANRFVIDALAILIRPRLMDEEAAEDPTEGEQRRVKSGGKRTVEQRTAHSAIMRAWWREQKKRRKAELNGW